MFKLYSKGCEYAIRALVHMAPEGETTRFQAKSVCKKAGIPESFTRKIFQSLVNGWFLHAVRGPCGGYALTKPPAEITLYEVILAVDGLDTFEGCILGLDECDATQPCPLHKMWAGGNTVLLETLTSKTLADLIRTTRERDVNKVDLSDAFDTE